MAKKKPVRKTPTKSPKNTRKTPGKHPIATRKKPTAARAGQGVALLDDQIAMIWVQRAEGASTREIAKLIDCHPSTVTRELNKDPARFAALTRVLAEDRAAKWKQIEHRSIELIVQMIDEIKSQLFTPTGRPRKIKNQETRAELMERMDLLRKMLGPIRMAADSSTKMTQLLTGSPTQILGGSVQGGSGLGVDPTQMTDEETIIFAVEYGFVEDLPKRLQEMHAKMRDAGLISG